MTGPKNKFKRPVFPNPQQKVRLCLGGCGLEFVSAGPGNRICPMCAEKDRSNGGLHTCRSPQFRRGGGE